MLVGRVVDSNSTCSGFGSHLALCGKDWRTAFTPISNPRKLANGAFYNWELFRALAALHNPLHEDETLALFDGLITPDMLRKVSAYMPDLNPYIFKAEAFSD